MKTQINNIVKCNQHIAGTDYEFRYAIAEKVIAENPESLTISYNLDGEEMTIVLKHCQSASGKTHWYNGTLTAEQAGKVLALDGDKKKLAEGNLNADVTIWNDMTIEFGVARRRNERCQWKCGAYVGHVALNANVTIL